MSRRRAVRRLVDPWAGLVLGALVVLGVVILLATPGPWQGTVGPARPGGAGARPSVDLAVFVVTGSAPGRCTAAAWVHVSTAPPRVSAVLVPPSVRAAVPGGGYAPVRRLVTDLDAATATGGLARALGVDLQGWVVVSEAALDRLFAAQVPDDAGRELLARSRAARAAFAAVPHDVDGLRLQHGALAGALRAAQRTPVKANAVVNYLLGSTDVRTDLDLRTVTAAVQAFFSPQAAPVAVRTAAAIIERCGPAREWRLDGRWLSRLRRSLALGVRAPGATPRVVTQARTAEVLVVAPSDDGAAFAKGVRDALLAQGALPVAVRAVQVGDVGAGERLAALLARRRPLAVVLVPWPLPGEPATEAPPGSVTSQALAAMTAVLHRAWQPAVLVAPPATADDRLREAALATGLPMVDLGPGAATALSPAAAATAPSADVGTWSAPRLVAAATARACWPAYLAPGLAGTRLEFSFAARRATGLGLVGEWDAGTMAWMQACGYAPAAGVSGWRPSPGALVAYRPGARRAALSVAGDLGLSPSAVLRDPTAPAVVTVVAP